MIKALKLFSLLLISLLAISACAPGNNTTQATSMPAQSKDQASSKDSGESSGKITFYDSFATW